MEQRTEDWFLARKGKVTASKIADVLAKGRGNAESLTRAKYRDQLVTERLTNVVAEGFTNEAMQRGTDLGMAECEMGSDRQKCGGRVGQRAGQEIGLLRMLKMQGTDYGRA